MKENDTIGMDSLHGKPIWGLESQIVEELQNYKNNLGIDIHPKIENDLISTIFGQLELNLSYNWKSDLIKGVRLVSTPKDLFDFYRLRAIVYKDMGYDKQFPTKIPGIEFDEFDAHSIVLAYGEGGSNFGNIRIILDSYQGLPSDKYCDLSLVKAKNEHGELSRLVVNKDFRGNNTSGKLYEGVFEFTEKVGMSHLIVAMVSEYRKRYEEFGGVTLVKEVDGYGKIEGLCSIISWNLDKVNKEQYVGIAA